MPLFNGTNLKSNDGSSNGNTAPGTTMSPGGNAGGRRLLQLQSVLSSPKDLSKTQTLTWPGVQTPGDRDKLNIFIPVETLQ